MEEKIKKMRWVKPKIEEVKIKVQRVSAAMAYGGGDGTLPGPTLDPRDDNPTIVYGA